MEEQDNSSELLYIGISTTPLMEHLKKNDETPYSIFTGKLNK